MHYNFHGYASPWMSTGNVFCLKHLFSISVGRCTRKPLLLLLCTLLTEQGEQLGCKKQVQHWKKHYCSGDESTESKDIDRLKQALKSLDCAVRSTSGWIISLSYLSYSIHLKTGELCQCLLVRAMPVMNYFANFSVCAPFNWKISIKFSISSTIQRHCFFLFVKFKQ